MENIRVLLADDHAIVRAGLRNALANLPELEVVGEVGDGPNLEQALGDLHPDLLVVDVHMPDFEPIAAISEIRDLYPTMKILVVSAYDDQAYVIGLLTAGVDGYHLKDQPLADLQFAVRKILAGDRWISGPLVGRLVSQQTLSAGSTGPALTPRQRELLRLLTLGYDNRRMAQEVGISVKTVENHLTALYRALDVSSRLEANNYAMRHPETLATPGHEMTHTRAVKHAQNNLRILLVDDNARYRKQMGRLIGKTCPSSTLYEAESCVEAARMARQGRPHLAFVDVLLPESDGIECVRRIRALCPETRIILISAYPDQEFRRLGKNAGAVAFLDKKDIEAATIQQVLDDMLIT